MLLFAHLGITLGTAAAAAGVNKYLKTPEPARASGACADRPGIAAKIKSVPAVIASWFDALSRYADIRAILIGAILPDIIDKPIGHWILAGELDNGRIFSHSLVFLMLVTLCGIFIYSRYRSTFFLAIAFGVLMHLVLDSMWLDPHALFWAFLGFSFEHGEPGNYLLEILRNMGHPNVFIPEITGLVILCGFGVLIIKRKSVWHIGKTGRTWE
jgi:membrane-bound metal-dependent hydrolase YbcI (DUF457 family)